MSMLIAIFGH